MAQEDYKTTIKIEADTKNAEQSVKREAAAFDGLSKSLDTIKNAAAAAWQSIAKLFESIGDRLTTLVAQVKELHSTVSDNTIAKTANEAVAATENLIEKQKELNETVAEQKPGEDLTAAANEAAAATENLTEKQKELNETVAERKPGEDIVAAANEAAAATENLTAQQTALNVAVAAQKPGKDLASPAKEAAAATENLTKKQLTLNAALASQKLGPGIGKMASESQFAIDAATVAQKKFNDALASQKPVREIAEAAKEAEQAINAAAIAQGRLNAELAKQKPNGAIAAAANNASEEVKQLIARQQELTAQFEAGAKRGKGAWESLIGVLRSARSMVTSVMRAFGLFYLAFEGLKSIYENTRKLVELWKEYKTAVERAALASSISQAVHETNRLSEAQKNLNTQLKEQLTLVQRAATLRSMAQSGTKSFTDEQRNVTRAIELAGATDPRQRQAIEDRYAREDEARQRTETRQTLTGRIGQLSAEAQAYTASAAQARELRETTTKQLDKEFAIQTQQKALNASDEEREATRKRIEALEATRAAALKEQKTFEEEAAYRNQQVQILQMQLKAFEQLGTSAEKVQQEAWRKIEEADAAASKQLADKLATNEAADKWEHDFAKATPTEKINMLQDKESSARNRLDTLQSALDDEMGKSVAERNQERMADLRSGIESAQNEMFAARRQREGIQEEAAVSARQEVTLGTGSRLNAMGLGAGSGVQRVQQEMANSLKDLVRLGRDQLAALKDIGSEDGGATFQ